MRFGNAPFFYLWWIVTAALIAFYVWAFKMRKKSLKTFAETSLLSELTLSVHEQKKRVKAIILCCAVFLLFFSFLRPQWGFHWQEVKRRGLDILIAIDTSKSMLAVDVKPNRLERSKLAVKDLLKKLTGDRIGLIAFSGRAFLECPLTVDYNGFMISLDDLSADTIPQGGTSISQAINEAIKGYKSGSKKYKILILITDGEDHEGDVLAAAEEAKKEGIKIYCIGIGTKEGELIPITDSEGKKTFLKDRDGNVVKSRLDETTLQKIALGTGGSYVHATGAEFGLDLIYEEKLSTMEKREFESKMNKQYEERYQIFLAIALALLLLEPFISERRKQVE
jgi:Ca-activated chloride channel homolog